MCPCNGGLSCQNTWYMIAKSYTFQGKLWNTKFRLAEEPGPPVTENW
jgi:hypothetical protein